VRYGIVSLEGALAKPLMARWAIGGCLSESLLAIRLAREDEKFFRIALSSLSEKTITSETNRGEKFHGKDK
jgi:hypothetical protein